MIRRLLGLVWMIDALDRDNVRWCAWGLCLGRHSFVETAEVENVGEMCWIEREPAPLVSRDVTHPFAARLAVLFPTL